MNVGGKRLHSDREWLILFLFAAGLAGVHFAANLFGGQVPQAVAYVLSPAENKPLSQLYIEDGVISPAYLIRNYGLRFAIYPVLLFTFLADRFGLARYLRRVSWRVLAGGLMGVGAVGLLVSKPYLFTPSLVGGSRAQLLLVTQVRFEGSSAHVYVYAIVTWILLAVLCFRVLDRKLPKHAALWVTFLIFMSVEEVWEYANYVWGALPITYMEFVNPPPLHFFTLYLWRATPTFILLFYAYRWGFKQRVQGSWMERLFFVALTASALLIIFPTPPFSFWMSLSLRIFWSAAYVAFAYYLNGHHAAIGRVLKPFPWRMFTLSMLTGLIIIFASTVRGVYTPAWDVRNIFPTYLLVALLGCAGAYLALTDNANNHGDSAGALGVEDIKS